MTLINEIYSVINNNHSTCYKNQIVEDNKIGFSINDDRVGRVVSVSVEFKDGSYIASGYECSQISCISSNKNRSETKEVKSSDEFWKWYSNFYNDMH
jgi:hypothetical protein